MKRRTLLKGVGASALLTFPGAAAASNDEPKEMTVRFQSDDEDVTITEDCFYECCQDCPTTCDTCGCGGYC